MAISPNNGGTEHATYSIAKYLQSKGNACFSSYSSIYDGLSADCFDETVYTPIESFNNGKFRNYIIRKKIDVIINESGGFGTQKIIHDAVIGLGVRLIAVHHFEPKWFPKTYKRPTFSSVWHSTAVNKRLLVPYEWLRLNILHKINVYKDQRSYKSDYDNSDALIVLSENFIPTIKKYARLRNADRIFAIPNPLSYNFYISENEIKCKEKMVLIVSRLHDKVKRISVALRILGDVMKDSRSKGWNLVIIGDGPDRERYDKYIKENGIKSVSLLGKRTPIEYYKKASIFMMTSITEGLPLVLTESMQLGVVPFAFDTFSSVHDIINEKNGIIVNDMDIDNYTEQMLQLMSNEKRLKHVALNAVKSCHRYETNVVGKKWERIINF